MPYATEHDLKDRLGADVIALLADEDGDGAGDTAVLTAALADADAHIDRTLSARFAVPFDPPPPALLRLAVDLAIYFLFLRRRDAIPAANLDRAKQAIEQLNAIAEGRSALEGAAPRLSRFQSDSTTRETPRVFDADRLDLF